MKKIEYCLMLQEDDGKKKIHYWAAFLFTNEGLVEILKSESWMKRNDYSHYAIIRTQRAIMMSKLGSEGWEWIEGSGVHDTFKRSQDE